ncbi:rhodanese-related sulfurtransferase [Paracoccus sediminicola]|uniref:oxygen-dependent tRNA uridine(34) hydroxylase TrhO n=1 Tax=Paracoccus sediminicola TaxID=3017783 RepID=UPI0022F0E0E5|nr:rhodanese-related sulfurtransferase [Paracoccus sediminicola]WBU56713.1 rhodanese-related sulfurtransferase [Paracoccus sediminicola]
MLIVAALYHFTPFPEPQALKAPLARIACGQGVRGTLLLAPEGINGTIAGTRQGIDAVISHIRALPGCADLSWKESTAETMPFARMKVRIKCEIVTMGQPDVDPRAAVGRYVEPQDWNALIASDDVALIDTRNDYEVGIGTFDGAIDPGTVSFRDFPSWWQANAHRFEGKRVAMFCTGGIRCEKSTNYLISQGVEEVFHLKGGILKYLEEVPEAQSRWRGECFVFDQRVSLGHGLQQGSHSLCHACRRPLSAADRQRPEYEEGVSCHRCLSEYSDADRARFRERQRQVELAERRGQDHIGADHGKPRG